MWKKHLERDDSIIVGEEPVHSNSSIIFIPVKADG